MSEPNRIKWINLGIPIEGGAMQEFAWVVVMLSVAAGITATCGLLLGGHWVVYAIGWLFGLGLFSAMAAASLVRFLFGVGSGLVLGVLEASFAQAVLGFLFGYVLCAGTSAAGFVATILFYRFFGGEKTA